ncbi:MAG: NAD(P)(+) transhydrogenase (Re/Si-specific) subunit alpha, partial [Acidimicrobiales bacterium]
HDGVLSPDFDDEIVAGTCVVRDGVVVHAPTAEALGLAAPPGGSAAPPGEDAAPPGDADQPTTEEAGS